MLHRNPQQAQSLIDCDKRDEDTSFIIRNLDTGDCIDARDESHIEVMLASLSTNILAENNSKQTLWKGFWEKAKELNEKLWDAAETGNSEVVEALVQNQQDMRQNFSIILKTVKDESDGQSPLDIQQEEEDGYRQLLDVNSRSLDGWTALHFAVNEGHARIVEILIEAKANPSLCTSMKRTALHIAALRNHFDIVKILLNNPLVDVNAQDSDFNTPLHIAAELGSIQITAYLLDHGANPTIQNFQSKNAYDLTLYPEVRNLIKSKSSEFSNYNPALNYQRSELGGIIVPNSRSDHIERLMIELKRGSGKQKSQEGVNSPNKKSQRISKIARITINLKENQGPQHYKWHKMLGKGSFGEVYLASRKSDNMLFAIKVLSKEKVFAKNLTRYAQTEKNVLSVMNHPFIVKLHAAFQNKSKLFLVLDFCPGGDLGSMLCRFTRFSEEVAKFYIAEVILALESLHRNCIIFRDLKPDNVVIDHKGHARLTDFGLSKEGIYNNLTKSFCGSIAYLSPEVLLKRGHSRTVDWYLVGVLLYELIVGIPPYYNQNREQLFENIKRGPLRIPKTMSEDAKDLIKQLLVRDPGQRLGSLNDAADIKVHPFFRDTNWDDLEAKVKDGPYIEKDKTERYLKETIEVNFDAIPPELENRQKISDWSFVQ